MQEIQALIESLLMQKIGIDTNIIGKQKIAKAVQNRCFISGVKEKDSYWKLLQTSPREFAELVELIVVPETWFFRDRQPFEFLINYVRSQWLPKAGGRKLHILSVPCSSGEEPYSIAMTLLEAGLSPQRFSIDAIDISKQAIAKAERAIYGKNSFRGEDFVDRQQYFQATDLGYQLRETVRQTVNFRQANLLNISCELNRKYDIIFCRNLLIYLEASACNQVIKTLDRLLVSEGLLFVGAAEMAKINNPRFSSIRQRFTFAYQKIAAIAPIMLGELSASSPIKPHSKPQISTLSSPAKIPDVAASITLDLPLETSKLAESAENPNVTLEIARKLADEGEIEAALEHCQKYLNSYRTSADAYTLLGTLYQAKAENAQAEQCYHKALYLNPHSYETLMQLALLKESRGDRLGSEMLQKRLQRILQSATN